MSALNTQSKTEQHLISLAKTHESEEIQALAREQLIARFDYSDDDFDFGSEEVSP